MTHSGIRGTFRAERKVGPQRNDILKESEDLPTSHVDHKD